MELTIREMTNKEAKEICTWKYNDIYSFYNMDEDGMDELMNGSYYSAFNEDNRLIGFYCFGESAIVPAGNSVGAYNDQGYLDIGLGMMPELCGKGSGAIFMIKGLEFAKEKFNINKFRLTVAIFNKRAVKVYEKLGFNKDMLFNRVTNGSSTTEFITMKLE